MSGILLGKPGKIEDAGLRDASHVAVTVAEAMANFEPGENVAVIGDKAYNVTSRLAANGVVDPFLRQRVLRGQAIVVLMDPSMVANLRHAWDGVSDSNAGPDRGRSRGDEEGGERDADEGGGDDGDDWCRKANC